MKESKKEGRFGRVMGILISIICVAAVSMAVLYFYPNIMEQERELGYYHVWVSEDGLHYNWYIHQIPSDYYLVAWCAVAAAAVLALLLPFFRVLGLKRGIKANIPLELLCVIVPMFVVFIVDEGGLPDFVLESLHYMDDPETALRWNGMLKDFMTKERENILLYIVNGLVWFATLSVAYISVLSIRQLFSKGPIRYLKENTITGIVLCFIIKHCKKFVRSIQEIDFEEKGTKTIWKAVLVNFIVLTLLCCVWFIGIPVAIIY